MNIEHQNQGHFSSGSNMAASSDKSASRFSAFIEHVHSARTLYLIAAVLQVGLSLGVIFGSVIGFIQPLWFSTLVSMLASLSCIVGLYLLYSVTNTGTAEQLVRDAMRRIMNAQN